MSTRRILALLVVLSLSLGLCSVPAGSATLQRRTVTDDSVISVTDYKEGDGGEDIDGGDDDRWGSTDPFELDDETSTAAGDEEEGNGEIGDRIFGRSVVITVGIRTLLGFLVVLL